MNLPTKYAPRTFSDVAGHSEHVARLERFAAAGNLGGRAFWIRGPSGIGKSTIARLIANEVAGEENTMRYVGLEMSVEDCRDITRLYRTRPLFGRNGWAFVIEEAHTLRAPVLKHLLQLIDTGEIPDHCVWVLTTTPSGQASLFDKQDDATPLRSRCKYMNLTPDIDAFAEYARRIADVENLDGRPMSAYVDLVNMYDCNMRRILEALEDGEMLP